MKPLEQKIARLNQELEEAKRLKEQEDNKLTINITQFSLSTRRVTLKLSRYRADIVDYLRYNTDRIWDASSEQNRFSIHYLPTFLAHWANENIVWTKDAYENYTKWQTLPDLLVEVSGAYIVLTPGPKVTYNFYFPHISSFTNTGKGYRISLADIYLLPTQLQERYGDIKVEYSPEAKIALELALEKRREIALLANATDADIPNPLKNGYELRGHQKVAIKFAELVGGKAIIAYDMGTGKTIIAAGYAERHPEWKKVLIICPANLKTNWKREIKKVTNEDAIILNGIEPDNLSIDLLTDKKYRYYIINYDIIGREVGEKDDKIMKWVEVLNIIQPDLIITDEAHYIKNMDSCRSVGVRNLKYKNALLMSGTPLVNRPIELYPPLSIVAPDVFNSPTAFLNQYTDSSGNARNIKQLHDAMLPYMIRRTRKDVYGDKIHIERIPILKELSPTARANYEKILQGIYISLKRPDYVRNVKGIFAELIRCKQTCSADNVEASADLAGQAYDETEKKVIIFSQFKESQYAIEQMLGNESVVVNGDVTDDERYRLVDLFQDPLSEKKYWITNILEGLTLTQAHTVIFNDIWWTPKDHTQAEGRAFGRDNDPHGGNSYWLENENTIDQFLNALIMKKTALFDQLVDGVRVNAENEESVMSQLIQHLRGNL